MGSRFTLLRSRRSLLGLATTASVSPLGEGRFLRLQLLQWAPNCWLFLK